MAYEEMANVYDELMKDAPYTAFLSFTLDIFNTYGSGIKRVADLGCGTGEMTIRLANEGLVVYGIDYSEEMLTAAQQKAADEHVSIQWLHQDVRGLAGLENLDAAVSYFDVMNYITDPEDVIQVFRHTAEMLKPGGLFLFDVHSVNHVEEELAGETFAYVTEDLSYIWLSEAGELPGEVFHDLTFFVRAGNTYERFDEYHHQRTHQISFYEQELSNAGFRKVIWYSAPALKAEKADQTAERIFFLAIK